MTLPCAGSGENRKGGLPHTQFNSTLARLIKPLAVDSALGGERRESGSYFMRDSIRDSIRAWPV